MKKLRKIDKQHIEDTLLLVQAIVAAIDIVADDRHMHGGKPITLNAIINALVSGLAHYVAGISKDDDREAYFAHIGIELADMIDTNIERGSVAKAYTKEELH